jgi:hypothetical protein
VCADADVGGGQLVKNEVVAMSMNPPSLNSMMPSIAKPMKMQANSPKVNILSALFIALVSLLVVHERVHLRI